jgi:hypothetical protein
MEVVIMKSRLDMLLKAEADNAALRERVKVLTECAEYYASCSGEGCTCGDGWSHDAAIEALADGEKE